MDKTSAIDLIAFAASHGSGRRRRVVPERRLAAAKSTSTLFPGSNPLVLHPFSVDLIVETNGARCAGAICLGSSADVLYTELPGYIPVNCEPISGDQGVY